MAVGSTSSTSLPFCILSQSTLGVAWPPTTMMIMYIVGKLYMSLKIKRFFLLLHTIHALPFLFINLYCIWIFILLILSYLFVFEKYKIILGFSPWKSNGLLNLVALQKKGSPKTARETCVLLRVVLVWVWDLFIPSFPRSCF